MQDKKRAKVICHMYLSLDGKIVTELKGFPNNRDCEEAGEIYDRLDFSLGEAWGCGPTTFQTEISTDLSRFRGASVSFEDRFVDSDNYCFAFDRKGRLRWESPFMLYGGKKSQIVEVLTKGVSPEFVAYLDEIGIPYLFAGDQEMDLEMFLIKIREIYHIETFVLCGGPSINAEFMRKDLVDEISLVIAPGVQGGRKELTFVGTDDNTCFPKYFDFKEVETHSNNVIRLIYTKKAQDS